MKYYFTTPTVEEGPLAESALFRRYRLTRGVSVLKKDGLYTEVRYPSSEETTDADIFYLGGGTYEVSASEAADLQAAGYTVVTA